MGKGVFCSFPGKKVGGVGGDVGVDTNDVELEGRLGRNSGECQMASVLCEWCADKARQWFLVLLGRRQAFPQHHVPVSWQMCHGEGDRRH